MEDGGMSDLVQRFADLFEGRKDARGTVEGGCVYEPVGLGTYDDHLTLPNHSLGIYPLIQDHELGGEWAQFLGGPVGDSFVKWGCSDIDQDNPALAWNLHSALNALDITAWVEQTKSKGYHVWVFADEWVPALVMRRTLLVAHQVAGVAPTEVNPKQIAPRGKGLGNYVNLPYPHEATTRRVMIDVSPIPLEEFVELAVATRTSFETLRAAGKLYVEPPKPAVVVDRPTGDVVQLGTKLPGLAFTIFRDGPLEGRDRSGTLQRLAFLCAEAGLTPGETLTIVTNADSRWGKFVFRSDCDEQLQAIVTYAYSKGAS